MVCNNIGFMPWGYSQWSMPYNVVNFPFGYGQPTWATITGIQKANKMLLEIHYSGLLSDVNCLIITLQTKMANPNLTSQEQEKYNLMLNSAMCLMQRIDNFGRNSANIYIFGARNAINQYNNEYKRLKSAETALSQSISKRTVSTQTTSTPATSTPATSTPVASTPVTSTPVTSTPVASTPVTSTPATSTPATSTPTTSTPVADGVDSADEAQTVEQVKELYEKDLQKDIDEMIKDPNISAEDKKALEEKKKELEKAIEENKPLDEIKRLFNELSQLMVDTISRMEETKSAKDAKELKSLLTNATNLVRNIRQYNKDYKKYTDRADRVKLSDKMQELMNAVASRQPKDEIKRIYNELNALFTSIKGNVDKYITQADGICGAILKASDGVDWCWPWSGDTDSEKAIKASVNKINKTNVRAVLNRWNDVFKPSTGDSCLLETIYGEFKTDSSSKTEITQKLTKAIEEYAKSKGALNKVSGQLQIINGDGSYSAKYNAFNKIITLLNNM